MLFLVLLQIVFVQPNTGTLFDTGISLEMPNITDSILPDITNPMIPNITNPIVELVFQNRCIADLGCFYTGPPFYHPLRRPISLNPTDDPQARFILYTPEDASKGREIELVSQSVKDSAFDPNLPTKVLIHGYRTQLADGDIRFKIKDALLQHDNYNVIIVNWTANNRPPYPQAVANARVVGAQVAKFLKLFIDNFGIQPQSIHIIGHSLGGQMAGWIGERIPHIGRITALDPAGPYFHDAENLVRLDTTDADFVDIIHSDGGEIILNGLGISAPIGHMDFYPNGGRNQPGCFSLSTESGDTITDALINVTVRHILNGCDHGRANEFFLESIENKHCSFKAVKCESYSKFENGRCSPENSTQAVMGFHLKRIPNLPEKSKFFLRTNANSTYCNEDSIFL